MTRHERVTREAARRLAVMPGWAKIGLGVDAVLLVFLALVLMAAGGSGPSRQVASDTLPPVVTVPDATATTNSASTTTSTTAPIVVGVSGATATTMASGPATAGGPGATQTPPPAVTSGFGSNGQASSRRCVDPDDCSPLSPMTEDPRLRTPTAAEVAAIVADVAPPPGQQFDAIMLSVSDATWGVIHVATGDGHSQEYVAIHIIRSRWTAVDSGYPSLGCDAAIPSDVVVDLEALATPCA